MIAEITHRQQTFKVNLSKPIDISLPLKAGSGNPTAWYVPPVKMEAVKIGQWIGEVKQGGSVNFFDIYFNPHGHGTHTECLGHISKAKESVNELINEFFFIAQLITVKPEEIDNDLVITKEAISIQLNSNTEALIIRTLPNTEAKCTKQYSNTSPPFLHHEAAILMKNKGVKHLLVDLPSVDKEQDEGKLISHHCFWNFPENPRFDCSITELIYVPNTIRDGEYLLNLSFAPFDNDASPSRPTLYAIL